MIAEALIFHLAVVSCNSEICILQYHDFEIKNKFDGTKVERRVQFLTTIIFVEAVRRVDLLLLLFDLLI